MHDHGFIKKKTKKNLFYDLNTQKIQEKTQNQHDS